MQESDFLDKDSFYSEGGFQVTNRSKGFLATAAFWGKFLAITGFIGAAFMILAGVFMMFLSSSIPGFNQNPVLAGMGAVGFGFTYILFALVYIFPSLYLLRFAQKTKASIRNSDNIGLEEAFKNLKSFFMFIGITVIIFIVLYILIIVGAMIIGAAA